MQGKIVITFNMSKDEVIVQGDVPPSEIVLRGIMDLARDLVIKSIEENKRRKIVAPPAGMHVPLNGG